MQHDASREARQYLHEQEQEVFKSVIAYGEVTVKSALLINGGAAVAMLAFAGNLATRVGEPEIASRFAAAMVAFGAGAWLAVLGAGFGYIAQSCYLRELRLEFSLRRSGHRWRKITAITVGAAMLAFAIGVGCATFAVTLPLESPPDTPQQLPKTT